MTTQTLIEPAEMAQRIVDVLTDRQAEDVVMLDIHEVSSFTDFFVIGTAQNPRHTSALINAFEKDLANEGIKPLRVEGGTNSGWVLIDFGAVIVHIFQPEDREHYRLEALWSRAGVPAVRFQ